MATLRGDLLMALRGDLSSIKALKSKLQTLPKSIAHDVAQRAAPTMTGLARTAYDSGHTVYGTSRPAGVGGRALTLHKTGAAERDLRFVATGTVIRCVLGPKYAKYLVGKYDVLPNGALPAQWAASLRDVAQSFVVPP